MSVVSSFAQIVAAKDEVIAMRDLTIQTLKSHMRDIALSMQYAIDHRQPGGTPEDLQDDVDDLMELCK